VPVAVTTSGVLNGKTITQVAAGTYHSIALASDGTVYTWGYNSYGQLGNGNNTDSNVPVAVLTSGVLSGKTITQVAAGNNHSIALASDGTVYTWGYNGYGQLGNGTSGPGTNSNVPVAVYTSGVLNGKTITQVAAGYNHTIALASDGTVYTWGDNYYGQLGNGDNTNNSNIPVAVDMIGVLNGKTINQVAAGRYHSIALASDGTVYTWGYNYFGQLGINSNTDSNIPVLVSGALIGKTITRVAAGGSHSIALASDGTVYTWGRNNYGQLGNENNTNSSVPVAVNTSGVLSGKTITKVAAGDSHTIALASDGTVYTWGYNGLGQLGNGNNTSSSVPVAVDQSGMGELPVELTSFTANHADGKVMLCWQTATEVNNYGFEIQRSVFSDQLSAENWEKIGFVEGHGNSNSPKDYFFTDDSPLSGTVQYRLKQIDNDGKYDFSKEVEIMVTALPKAFALEQNYPNPFNPSTIISYQLPVKSNVELKIYDLLGNEVAALVNEQKEAGSYQVQFDGSKLSSGVYFYKLHAKGVALTKKLLLMK